MMMLRGLRAACLSALSLAALAQISAADPAADAKKAVQGIYAKRDAAAQKKDLNGVFASYSSDFVYVSKDGQKGDLHLLKTRLSPYLSLMQSIKAKTSIQKFTVKGKDATAVVKEHLEMTVLNPNTQMPQQLVADATSNDQWIKTANGWLQKRTVTKTETASVDGKPVTTNVNLHNDSRQASRGSTGKPARSHKAH